MPEVTIELPSMLARLLNGARTFRVEGDSIQGALGALVKRYPALRVHLFDERGGLRQHVLCFHNGENTRWRTSPDAPVAEGDRITILQAVSGG